MRRLRSHATGLAASLRVQMSPKYIKMLANLRTDASLAMRYGKPVRMSSWPAWIAHLLGEALVAESNVGSRGMGRYNRPYNARSVRARDAWLRLAAFAINRAEQLDEMRSLENSKHRHDKHTYRGPGGVLKEAENRA